MGVIHSTNSFLPLLRKGTTKKVATISSAGGNRDSVMKLDFPQMPGYGMSKAAVNMVIAKYATKLHSEGIVLVALSPGLVDTTLTFSSTWSRFFREQHQYL